MVNELLTVTELADRLRVRPRKVQAWARRGRIPAVSISPKVVRFELGEVVKALKRNDGREVRDAK